MPSSWGEGVLLPRVADVNEHVVELRQTGEFTKKDAGFGIAALTLAPAER
jgi:hypothetical protein